MASCIARFESNGFFGVVYVENKGFSVAHLSDDTLNIALLREWAKIPQETLRVSVGNFRQIIKLLIEKKGDHIENK